MGRSWFPLGIVALRDFAANLSSKISATPLLYNLVAADAVLTASAVANYVAAVALTLDPVTKTTVTIAARDVSRTALIAQLKAVKKKVDAAQPPIAPNRREELGLPPRDVTPTPVPVPSTRPMVNIMSVVGQSVKLRLSDESTPDSRRKPAGVSEAEVFTFIGANPPANPLDWHYEGQATKTSFIITFPTGNGTSPVWIAARWCNTRGEAGPMSARQTTSVGGIAMAA
jgi:hypothetical protein